MAMTSRLRMTIFMCGGIMRRSLDMMSGADLQVEWRQRYGIGIPNRPQRDLHARLIHRQLGGECVPNHELQQVI